MKAINAFFVFFLIASTGAAPGQTAREAFLNEYKPKPAFVQALQNGFTFRMNYSQFQLNFEQKNLCEGVMTPAGYYIKILENQKIGPDGQRTSGNNTIDLANPQYTASLDVKAGESYGLNLLQFGEKGNPPASCYLLGCLCDFRSGMPFAQAVLDPRVSVISFENSTFVAAPVKQLRLSVIYKFPQFSMEFLNDYFFDPEKDWLCVAYRERGQLKKQEGAYTETIHTFDNDRSKWSGIPKKIETWEVDEDKGSRVQTRVTEISEVVNRKVADEEFRLSHFGIAEPEGVIWPKPASPWPWLALGALGFGALGLSLALTRKYLFPKVDKQQ